MLSVTELPEFVVFVSDQLEKSGTPRFKKMFGGFGIYIDEIFCAIVSSSNRFYLRVGADNIGDFESERMPQFPGKKGAGMPYYEVPEQVLEDAEMLGAWVRKARDAALQARKKSL